MTLHATARRPASDSARLIYQYRSRGMSVDAVSRMTGASTEDVRRIAPFTAYRDPIQPMTRAPDPVEPIIQQADDLSDADLKRASIAVTRMYIERQRVQADRRSAKPFPAIVAEVAKAYGYTSDDIMGRSLDRKLSAARHAAYYEVRMQRPWLSYPQIGRLFGGRDHTTILYGIRKHERKVRGDV